MLYDGLGSVGAFGSMLAGAVRASMLKVGRSGQDFNVAAAPGMETFFVVRTKWGVPLERGGRRTPPFWNTETAVPPTFWNIRSAVHPL